MEHAELSKISNVAKTSAAPLLNYDNYNDGASSRIEQRVRVEKLDEVITELKLRLRDLKRVRQATQDEYEFLKKRSNELTADVSKKISFINECEKRHEEATSEANKWIEIWNSEKGKKLLAEARLTENAQLVVSIEEQMEYNRSMISQRRKMLIERQQRAKCAPFKEERVWLEEEIAETQKKTVQWQMENKRLLEIFNEMKESETGMVFTRDRCILRNDDIRRECYELQRQIFSISHFLDERSSILSSLSGFSSHCAFNSARFSDSTWSPSTDNSAPEAEKENHSFARGHKSSDRNNLRKRKPMREESRSSRTE